MLLLIKTVIVFTLASADAGAGFGSPQPDPVLPLVEGEGYQGVIFPVPPFDPKVLHGQSTWAPSANDVRVFERLLRASLKASLRDPRRIASDMCDPGESDSWCVEATRRRKVEIKSILGKLDRYRRQYAGVMVGSRKILVGNFFPAVPAKEDDWHPTWRHEWVNVLGGGAGYWWICFDIRERRFEGFRANSPR